MAEAKGAMQYFRGVRFELSKVVWPKLAEWVGSTVVVLLLVCAFAIYLGVLDFCFAKLANYIFKYYSAY